MASSSSAASAPKKEYNSCFRAQMRKTQLCKHFQKGKCRYGANCMFAHSQEELQNPPSLMKTSLCTAFAQGGCRFAAELCPYAHGREELVRTPAFLRKKGPNTQASTAVTTAALQLHQQGSTEAWEMASDGSMSEAPTCSTSVGPLESLFQSEFDDNDGPGYASCDNSSLAGEHSAELPQQAAVRPRVREESRGMATLSHRGSSMSSPHEEALMQATSMSPTGHCKDVLAHSAPTLRMPYQMLAGSQAVPGSQGTNMPMIFVPVFMMPMPYQQVQSA